MNTLDTVFTDTANIIRSKTGSQGGISPIDFADNIDSIPTDVITVEDISDIDTTKLEPDKKYMVFQENWSNLDGDFKGDCRIKLPLVINFPELTSSMTRLSPRIVGLFSDIQGSFLVNKRSGEVVSASGSITYRTPFKEDTHSYKYNYTYDQENNRFYLDSTYKSEPIVYLYGMVRSYSDNNNLLKYHKNNTYLGVYTAKYKHYLSLKSNLNNTYKYIFGESLGYYDSNVYYISDISYNENKQLTQFKLLQLNSADTFFKSGNDLYVKCSYSRVYFVYQITYINDTWNSQQLSSSAGSTGGTIKIKDVTLSGEHIFFNQSGVEPMSIYTSVDKSGIFDTSRLYESLDRDTTLEKQIESS